jgi:NAD(P)-dependent dehydrogenase (short-subunit alcohol dehydrogenase family)
MANSTPSPVAGKHVLITGGAGGVGRNVARRMAELGASVVITDRPGSPLDEVGQSLARAGNVKSIEADLSTREGVKALFDGYDRVHSRLDILVACTGVGSGPLLEMDDEGWRYVIESNLASYVACTKGAIDRIRAAGTDEGMVILVGSISVHIKAVGESVYNAAKGGVASFAETLRKEMIAEKIRVTLIEPGAIGTRLQPYSDDKLQDLVDEFQMLPADEVADAIMFAATRSKGVDVVTLRIEPLVQKIY